MADTYVTNAVQLIYTNDTDTLYGVLRDSAKQIRDVINSNWEAHPASGSLGDYDISAAVASGGLWSGSFPIEVGVGFYIYQIRLRATATPDFADQVVGGIKGYWDGTLFSEAVIPASISGTMIIGTIDTTVGPSTTEFEADDIIEATANHYNGRIIIFTSGVLLGQATDITAYELSGGRGHFTVTAMTDIPGNNDTFVIV